MINTPLRACFGHLTVIEGGRPADQGRGARRRQLMLESVARTRAGGEDAGEPALIHNVSETGLLLECGQPIAEGEDIEVDLPGLAGASARVVWNSGRFHGCAFAAAIPVDILRSLEDLAGQPARADAGAPAAVDLGERLLRMRKLRGLTLEKLAAGLGVSKPTVWAWEKGRARPTPVHIDALAAVLGVTRAELTAREPDVEVTRLISRCREQIAAAMGTDASKIRIYCEI